jgi:hypothetical protein
MLLCVGAWLVPGGGHLWLGRREKGVVFLAMIPLMFVTGMPWMVARFVGAGDGVVTAATWEYGNAFMIVAGLLNFLIILDAYDIAMGRK